MSKFIIYTDGGSRANPGKAAAAFVIYPPAGHVPERYVAGGAIKDGVYLGIATNNEAEYQAVKLALEKLQQDFTQDLPADVEIRADSKLVVEQLKGNFKVKNPRIKILYDSVKKLEQEVGKVSYNLIPRLENFQADSLANQILDQAG